MKLDCFWDIISTALARIMFMASGMIQAGTALARINQVMNAPTLEITANDIMSRAKYGDIQAFVKKLRNMGYERVELIDTTDGRFMKRSEAAWMGLSGSALLVGIK